MEQKDDKTLVREVLGKKHEVFRILVERHQGRLFYLGLKFFHSQAEAEDFTQEVFLQAFRKLNSYTGRGRFSAWLYRMAFNMAVNKYNLNKQKLLSDYPEDQLPDYKNSGPEEILLKNEERKQLEMALQRLPDRCNIILKMHFYDGLSYGEISHILDMPVNTIKSDVKRSKVLIESQWNILQKGDS